MFSELDLYYLNQIGINPWIGKETKLLRLVVLLPTALSDKGLFLFRQVMFYLKINKEELLIINFHENWLSQLENKTPMALFVLKAMQKDELPHLPYPVIQSLDLEELLLNPVLKKNVFQDLNHLKQLICDP